MDNFSSVLFCLAKIAGTREATWCPKEVTCTQENLNEKALNFACLSETDPLIYYY